jgi:lipoyl(octanoyl) transferase
VGDPAARPALRIELLGDAPYEPVWSLQKRMVAARAADEISDTLLVVEHQHTYTLGSSGHESNILLSPEEMAERGITIFRVDRGGDVTYHGPGQLVGYPILKLPRTLDNGLRADVIAYVRNLEEVIIRTLADFGILARREPGLTGVWVDAAFNEHGEPPAKIAAIGVKVTTRGVTYHGFALNIDPDMSYFAGIIPCGITDKPVTSMARLLGYTPELNTVLEPLIHHFGNVFELVPTFDHPLPIGEWLSGDVTP